MIATVDYHHLYYKDYWLAPSKANLNGYTLEISPAPMYYVYMAFLLAEIMTTIGIIISSYCSQRSMPNKGKIHFLMIAAMLSPMLLLSLRILKILKGDDPTPLGILLSCIFMSIAVVKYGLFDPVKNAKNYIIKSTLKSAGIVCAAIAVAVLIGTVSGYASYKGMYDSSKEKKEIHQSFDWYNENVSELNSLLSLIHISEPTRP